MNRFPLWTEGRMAWFFTGKYWRAVRSILFGEAACILKSVMIRGKLFHSFLIRQDLKIYT